MAKLSAEELKKLPKYKSSVVAEAGKDTLLYIDKGGDTVTPNWVVAGGQRNSPVQYKANEIDASHKTSGGWDDKVAGTRSWTIDYTGLYIMGDEAVQILDHAFRNSLAVHVKVQYPDESYQVGWASVTEFSREFPHDNVATLKVTLNGKGPISEIVAKGEQPKEV